MDLLIAYYQQQRAGETMHSPKHCLPGAGWEIWNHGTAELQVDGRMQRINQYQIQNAGERLVVLYWYQSRRRIIASEYWAKVLLAKDALSSADTSGSLVRITFPDEPGRLQEGLEFSQALIPEVARCLGR